ncbi:snapalysin family zinc-dependent metalloprotease [Allorhizocola rhizosphaerae]|uniref:snapalysin family zinc-dependent metalloprotease n=1 Tax=Allorhizocola rhizosphaerae TaxID=1872709 RepID=UPI000E3C60CB|nr:snapalysin family zinc-dependent metalloprotease [Allorhizocola rhizosphaerae]
MDRRSLFRAVVGVAAAIGAVIPTQLVAAAPASAAVRVLYYDASAAGEFVNVVHQGAANWNASVTNVRLERWTSGRPRNIVVTVDNNWPRAYVTSLGNGRWVMGRQAVNQGYHPPRIAAHEFGHLLGLPDRRTGLCADLMSGSSAPVSCTNAFPNSRERSEVQANFAGSLATGNQTEKVFVDF